MTEAPEMGDLIRESRLALGYSLGQLATKVGRTPATVRTWERGEAVPNEESRAALVKVLDIDPVELEALVPQTESDSDDAAESTKEVDSDGGDAIEEPIVGVTVIEEEGGDSEPEPEDAAAVEAEEGDADPDGDDSGLETAAGVAVAAALVDAADADLHQPSNDAPEQDQSEDPEDDAQPRDDDAEGAEEAADEDEQSEPVDDDIAQGDAVEDSDTDLPLVPLVAEEMPLDEVSETEQFDSDHAVGDADDDDTDDTLEGIAAVAPFEVDPALIDEPTEAVVVPVVATATGVATQTRSVVTVSEPKERGSRNPVRVLFDPNKRWLYWIRALFTLVVAAVLVVVLLWAVGELFDALGQVLDSIEPTEVDEDGIDALGRIRTLI